MVNGVERFAAAAKSSVMTIWRHGSYVWVKRPNDAFAGRAALDIMLQGAPADISRVRAYLDAERGAW